MMTSPSCSRYKEFAAERTNKEAHDRDIFAEAMEKAKKNETALCDSHFVIGSFFHSTQLNGDPQMDAHYSERIEDADCLRL